MEGQETEERDKTVSSILFSHSSFKEFINDYFSRKKRKTPTFSHTVWARKLGLANKSSLTRLLTGSRNPGHELRARLEAYFEFPERQLIYFRLMIQMVKPGISEEVKQNCFRKMQEIRNEEFLKAPYLVFQAQQLVLWGTVDRNQANKFLEKYNLRSADTAEKSYIGLRFSNNFSSSAGPYKALNVIIPVLKGEERYFLYTANYCSDDSAQHQWNKNWSAEYKKATILTEFNAGPRSAVASEAEKIVELRMATLPCSPADDRIEARALAGTEKPSREYEIIAIGKGETRNFDPANDIFEIPEMSPLRFLLDLGFSPERWTFHPELRGEVYLPNPPPLAPPQISKGIEQTVDQL